MVNCEIWTLKYHGELRNLALKISWRTAKLSTQNIMVNCEIWPSKYHGKLRNWPSDFRGQLRNYSLQISCGVRAVFVISGASWIQWRLSLFFQDIGSLQLHLRSLSDHAGLTSRSASLWHYVYVGAYTAWDHMFSHVKWRDETEIPLVMLLTVLQDCKKGIGTFWIFQDENVLRFLNEIQCVITHYRERA